MVRARGLSSVIIVLTLAVAVAPTLVAGQCSQFQRCSECVFDATVYANDVPLKCAWCSSSSSCKDSRDQCDTPSSVVDSTSGGTCPDMCGLSSVTGNIYFCRPGMIVSFIFALILLFVSIVYFVWMRAIQQRPWRFANIHDVVANTINSGAAGALKDVLALTAHSLDTELTAHDTTDSHTCPGCGVPCATMLGPGQVCFWCEVARWALFPFAAGITSSVVCIFMLFAVSLKPWFADAYYAIFLTVPFVIFLGFIGTVVRLREPVVGDRQERRSMFVSFALLLRCRDIEAVLKEVHIPPAGVAAAGDGSGEGSVSLQSNAPSALELRSATTYLVELETSLRAEFRQKLKDELKHDEVVVWWQAPSQTVALIDHRWVVHVTIAFLCIALWLFAVGGLPPNRFPQLLLAPSSLRTVAAVMLLFFGFVVITLIAGLSRVYVMTNERLICIVKGVLGQCHVSSTPLQLVTGATVFGYQEFGYSVVGIEWDTAVRGMRRMPPLRTNKFVGVVEIDKLVQEFRRYAPKLKTQQIKTELAHLRWVWTVHVILLLGVVVASPVVLVASMIFPTEIGSVALILFLAIVIALVQRGVRVFGTTTRAIDLAKDWKPFGEQGFQLEQLFKVMKAVQRGTSHSPQRAAAAH